MSDIVYILLFHSDEVPLLCVDKCNQESLKGYNGSQSPPGIITRDGELLYNFVHQYTILNSLWGCFYKTRQP